MPTTTIINRHPIIRFSLEHDAQQIAKALQADDKDWTYTVEPSGEKFVIVIRDEEKNVVGCV